MSSPFGTSLPISLLYYYHSLRRRPDLVGHERQIALLEAANIRHLSPLPSAAVASNHLSPASPPPPIQFSLPAHQQLLADDDDEFTVATTLSVAEFTLFHTHVLSGLLRSRTHYNYSTSPHAHSMPTELTTSDQLLLWLLYLSGDRVSHLTIYSSTYTVPHSTVTSTTSLTV